MNRSESIKEIGAALAKAQGEIEGAKKDSQNPFFKSSYADLASIWGACREPLSKNGLSIAQTTYSHEGQLYLETTLLHSSGEWISGELPIRPVKDDPQGVGSAITYMRRYGLQAMVGIAPEDDDGNAASGRNSKPQEKLSGDALKETSAKHRDFITKNLPSAKHTTVMANQVKAWYESGELTQEDYDTLVAAITKKYNELKEKANG